jgi:hypothetical protein
MQDKKEIRQRIIDAAYKSINELIKVLEESIVGEEGGDLSADKLKNAVSAKRTAFEDALYLLQRIDNEEEMISKKTDEKNESKSMQTFAERRGK